MKKYERKVREFLSTLELFAIPEGYGVHPTGLIIPSLYDTGNVTDLYGDVCPLAVLDEDTFSDALHFTLEEHIPKLLLAAFAHQAGCGFQLLHLLPLAEKVLKNVDWSAVECDWTDDDITALLCPGGMIMDYVEEDGLWLVVRPSANLISALVAINSKAHAGWVHSHQEKAA